MTKQLIFRERREYNRWVANQSLEDYALRFTATSARRWSLGSVANTALGSISFLALEAIGGAITINYGFDNAILAIMIVSVVIFFTGAPISYYAAKYGVDIDLLSRGASFGYIGSTITSFIYATFTFIFFAIEAAIMSSALQLLFEMSISLAYIVSSLIIIPLATHGITFISRFQLWSQPVWIAMQIIPLYIIITHDPFSYESWTHFNASGQTSENHFNLIYFGAASAVLFSLIVQIGEQVDFLRFMPEFKNTNRKRWWAALLFAGPGWIIIGTLKILAGSFLAVLAINHGIDEIKASDPIQMYNIAFTYITSTPQAALVLSGIFVILCQLKINVTNAYAGSIAWSNFFSRLTHSHPGRVVWLVFNVIIALLLMQMGIYEALENTLALYSNVAVAWVGTIVADLIINKPLGLSPKHIEFKRAHLYDINPVGIGSMILASALGITCYTGILGESLQALSPYLSLLSSFIFSPLIALLTKGNYYIARAPQVAHHSDHNCTMCENNFEHNDIAYCPTYDGPICSLCCAIDSRCHDHCKPHATIAQQASNIISRSLPAFLKIHIDERLLQFTGLVIFIGGIIATVFLLAYHHGSSLLPDFTEILSSLFVQVYLMLIIIIGVLIWLFVLANHSRKMVLFESQRQTQLLVDEIAAHQVTDKALQLAKETAEAANQAKSRYLANISHELRSPLNSILGYAQLLQKENAISKSNQIKINLIRRSCEHLEDLIEGLLDISRIEAGRMETRRDTIASKTLISELVQMYSQQAETKGIAFEFIGHNRLPDFFIADEKHLRQILINLLSNAIKYTQNGKVTFSIRYRSMVGEFSIKDSGIGIDGKSLQTIFEPFVRLDNPVMPKVNGTGLGLTISKFLTEIMGGDLAVSSEINVGTEFRLSIMLPATEGVGTPVQQAVDIRQFDAQSKSIMVVDDNDAHRNIIAEILSPRGFRVSQADNADDCLAQQTLMRIDLFLLDIAMPGKNGWELLSELRQRGVTAPIIMVSANAMRGKEYNSWNKEDMRSNDDYIVKPVKENVLFEKISNVLKIDWGNIHPSESILTTHENHLSGAASLNAVASHQDWLEVIAFAEQGYIEGLNQKLTNFRKIQTAELSDKLQNYLDNYQFPEIVKLARQALK